MSSLTAQATSRQKALSRMEFVAALVRVAIKRRLLSATNDCSEALERLFTEDILPRIGHAVLAPDAFRRDYAYTREVSLVLERYRTSLLTVFQAVAEVDKPRNHIGLLAWRNLCRALSLYEGSGVSERDTTLCFIWSVMAVGDGQTALGHVKETTLPFEGFLEALCRLATLVALPLDEEIEALGCEDAGTALQRLKIDDRARWERMRKERTSTWGRVQPFPQPFHRRVEHVLTIVLRKVDMSEDEGGPLFLTVTEVRRWIAANRIVGEKSARL